MSGKATAQVLGRLGRDPEVRFLPNGTAKVSFSLAVSHQRKDEAGNWVEAKPSWVDCVLWGKRGEAFARFHAKGDLAFVLGELRQDTWDDKQTGQKRSRLYVNGGEWDFVGSKKTDAGPVAEGDSSNPDKMFEGSAPADEPAF